MFLRVTTSIFCEQTRKLITVKRIMTVVLFYEWTSLLLYVHYFIVCAEWVRLKLEECTLFSTSGHGEWGRLLGYTNSRLIPSTEVFKVGVDAKFDRSNCFREQPTQLVSFRS